MTLGASLFLGKVKAVVTGGGLLASPLALPAVAADFHVSSRGNDAHEGTAKRPLATLSRAVELARQVPANTTRRIVMHGGSYFDVAVTLGPADSGLTIEAAPREKPVLHGGRWVTGFRAEEAPLVAAELPASMGSPDGIRMLCVNSRLAPRARFPANGRCYTGANSR